MKTKQMLTVVAMLAGMLCSQKASAFYNSTTGKWLSRDKVDESSTKSLYAFSDNEPVSKIDWLGLLKVSVLNIENNKCANTAVEFKYQLDRTISEKGYIVIENTLYHKVNENCEGGDCPRVGKDRPTKFWEAFPVTANHDVNVLQEILHWSDTAAFALRPSLKPSCGYSSVSGIVKFFSSATTKNLGSYPDDNGELPLGWIDPNKDSSHRYSFVPYTLTKPTWWDKD